MKKILSIGMFIVLFNIILVIENTTALNPTIYLFYGQGCQHCARALTYFNNFDGTKYNLITREVYFNDSNKAVLETFAKAYNTTIEGVPIIFINDKMFVGFSSEIGEKIKAEVERCCSIPCVDLTLVEKGEITNIANYSSSNAQDYSLIGWVFLIIVAILLMVFVLRKMKRGR